MKSSVVKPDAAISIALEEGNNPLFHYAHSPMTQTAVIFLPEGCYELEEEKWKRLLELSKEISDIIGKKIVYSVTTKDGLKFSLGPNDKVECER